MQRRDFLSTAGLLAGLAATPNLSFGQKITLSEPIEPILLPAREPLDHKGGMDIRVWVRSAMTGGVYSSVECAVAPRVMGPPPHLHKELDEAIKELKAEQDIVDTQIKQFIGESEILVHAGKQLASYKPVTTNRFDSTAFKKADPATYAQYTKPSTSRTFRVS